MSCKPLPPLVLETRAYTANPTTTRGWNDPIWTDPATGTQYVGWVGDLPQSSERRLMLAKREDASPNNPWQRASSAYTGQGFEDTHNAISITTHLDGRPIVSWGMHDDPLKIFFGRTPGDVNVNRQQVLPLATGGDTLEASVTYPNFRRFANGDIAFFFRGGSSGEGDLIMYFYTEATETWSIRQNPLVSGEGVRSFYPDKIQVDSAERIHVSGCWRETFASITTNHDLIHIYSSDKGVTWNRADGTSQALPVTTSNDQVVWSIPQNTGLMNTQGMTVDANGCPAIFRWYGAAPSQYYCHYWNGTLGGAGSWARSQVGTEGGSSSYVDDPDASTPRWIGQPMGLFRNGVYYMLFWSLDRGQGLWCAHSTDRSSWTIDLVDSNIWENCEANCDKSLWDMSGILDVIYQDVDTPLAQVEVRRIGLPT